MRLNARPNVADLVVAAVDLHLRLQIAFGHALGGADQAAQSD